MDKEQGLNNVKKVLCNTCDIKQSGEQDLDELFCNHCQLQSSLSLTSKDRKQAFKDELVKLFGKEHSLVIVEQEDICKFQETVDAYVEHGFYIVHATCNSHSTYSHSTSGGYVTVYQAILAENEKVFLAGILSK